MVVVQEYGSGNGTGVMPIETPYISVQNMNVHV